MTTPPRVIFLVDMIAEVLTEEGRTVEVGRTVVDRGGGGNGKPEGDSRRSIGSEGIGEAGGDGIVVDMKLT